jgi:membrane protein implicated in regulation of membrane protease activity
MQGLITFYQSQPFWTWAALAAAILAVEIVTGSGWLLWASASAGVTALAALAGLDFPAALLVWAALTVVSTLLARRYVPRSLASHAHDINDNVARLVGHEGAAVAAVRRGAGRVFIDGKEWAAELDGGGQLEAGAPVRVTAVQGARLRVRRAGQEAG